MKKLLYIFLCAALLLPLFCACGNGGGGESAPESGVSADESRVPDVSESGVSAEESAEPFKPDHPYISGTFIQPYLLNSMSAKKLEKHCSYLLEVGIDTIILQWSVTDKDGVVNGAYYPCTLNEGREFNSAIISKLLEACRKTGVKVIMGLNSPDDWFSAVLEDESWYRREAELGVKVARELYSIYKEKYPETLCGWYFAPEYYSGIAHNDRAADFLNLYIDGLNDIDPSMPLCFSPFLKSSVTPENTRKQWTEIFSLTHFRKGDVFMPQDSVGAGGIQLAELDVYFAALKQAVDTCPGLVFWANNECFTSTYKSAPFVRVAQQIEITGKYTERNVTFAYSHYVSPDITGSTDLHEEYLRYYLTGEYDKPEINERESYDGPKTLVSVGKPYTGAVSTRGDIWDDNGTKLTDGEIPSCDGNTPAYFGAENNGAEIIIDLGATVSGISEFRLYDCFGNWGITSIESVTYYVSEDGESWIPAGDTVRAYTLDFVESSDLWSLYDFRCVSAESLSGRYVKAVIENGGWMWISEFCVYTYDGSEG